MASYYVALAAGSGGIHPVHDRSRCPPACFPRDATEYLGEYGTPAQALVVARLVYATATACTCCDPLRLSALQWRTSTALRS